jgi:hypothetical protein
MILYLNDSQLKQNSLKSDRHFQQSSGIQNQYTKINIYSIYKQWTFIITSEEIKHLQINLMKKGTEHYKENYKTLIKNLKKTL